MDHSVDEFVVVAVVGELHKFVCRHAQTAEGGFARFIAKPIRVVTEAFMASSSNLTSYHYYKLESVCLNASALFCRQQHVDGLDDRLRLIAFFQTEFIQRIQGHHG